MRKFLENSLPSLVGAGAASDAGLGAALKIDEPEGFSSADFLVSTGL